MRYTFSDYEQCVLKLKDVFDGYKGIHSIMQFGNVSAPGQSDIDLIFVIDNDSKIYKNILKSFEVNFTEAEKHLIYQHQPYFIPENIVSKINAIRPCSNIKYIYGKQYEIQDKFDIYHKVYLLVELLTNYYPPYLTMFSDIRLNLQVINAFRFVLDLYRAIARTFGLSNTFYEQVGGILKKNDHIRTAEDFDRTSAESFIKISQKQLIDVIFLMFEQLDHVLEKCMDSENISVSCIVYKGKIFSKKQKKFYVLKIAGRTFNLMHYPLRFYYLFGECDCLIDDLRKNIEERNQVLETYKNFCQNYTNGNVFYLPWWMTRKISSSNRIKTGILTVLSKLTC